MKPVMSVLLLKQKLEARLQNSLHFFALLYYLEIIYIMIYLNFLFSKRAAVLTGLFLSALLAIHVIMLFNRREINRRIQLYLMDIHFGYSLAYFFNRLLADSGITAADLVVITLRICMAASELILLFVYTGRDVKRRFV